MDGRSRLTAGMGASGYLLRPDDPQPGVDVAVTSLDSFADKRRLDRIDMVKIDIEGHEERMLLGSRRVLLDLRPILVLELLDQHLIRGGSSRARVECLLGDAGYTVYLVANSNDAVAFPGSGKPDVVPDSLLPIGS